MSRVEVVECPDCGGFAVVPAGPATMTECDSCGGNGAALTGRDALVMEVGNALVARQQESRWCRFGTRPEWINADCRLAAALAALRAYDGRTDG